MGHNVTEVTTRSPVLNNHCRANIIYIMHLLLEMGILTIRYFYRVIYEGKSLNSKNFITTFLQEYLQKLFVSYFSA